MQLNYIDASALLRCLSRLPFAWPSGLLPAERKTRFRTAVHVSRVLYLGLLSVGLKMTSRNLFLNRLFLSVWYHSLKTNSHEFISDFKGTCFLARKSSLSTGKISFSGTMGKLYPRGFTPTRSQLFQLSCMSRALPRPVQGSKPETEAIKSFQDIVTVPAPKSISWGRPEKSFLSTAYSESKKIAKRFRKGSNHKLVGLYSTSSTATSTRREGGRLNDIRRILEIEKVRDITSTSQMAKAFEGMTDPFWDPPCPSKITSVMELGYKVRIVTSNDPIFVTWAHKFRAALFDLVCDRKTCSESLGALPDSIDVIGSGKRFVYSADLKTATDALSHRWLSWICKRLGLFSELVHTGFTIGVDGHIRDVVRGAFMGMPISWTLLEFTHYCMAKTVDPSLSFRIKGDDLIAYWSQEKINKYLRLLDVVGFIPNHKKSFKDLNYGTYCEAFFAVSSDKQRLVRKASISIRGLVERPVQPVIPQARQWAAETVNRGVAADRVMQLVECAFPKFRQWKRALHPYMPAFAGGLGFPHPRPNEAMPRKLAEILHHFAVENQGEPRYSVSPKHDAVTAIMYWAKRLKYSSGVTEDMRCPHIEPAINMELGRACFQAYVDKGLSSVRPVSMGSYIRELKKLSKRPNDLKGGFNILPNWSFATTVAKNQWPNPGSVMEMYPHCCRIAGMDPKLGA